MSFDLFVQQNQWIVVALLGGGILTGLLILTYTAMWRGREEESERESKIRIETPASFFQWLLSFMPWVLILLVIGSVVYTITHILAAALELPNW